MEKQSANGSSGFGLLFLCNYFLLLLTKSFLEIKLITVLYITVIFYPKRRDLSREKLPVETFQVFEIKQGAPAYNAATPFISAQIYSLYRRHFSHSLVNPVQPGASFAGCLYGY